jgi:hypothetical protein
MNKITREQQSQNYDYFVLNIIRSYPVGSNQVDRHIKRFYIDTGLIELREGRLYPPTK